MLLPQTRPHNSRSPSSFLQASFPKTLCFARSLYQYRERLVVSHFPNPVTSPPSTVSAAPATSVVPFQSFVLSLIAHQLHLRVLRHRLSWEYFTQQTYFQKQRLRAVLCPMAPFSPCRLRSLHPSPRPPCSPMSVPPKWDHIPVSSTQPLKECLCRPCGNPPCHQCRGSCWSWTISQNPCLLIYLCYALGYPNHLGMATCTMQTVTSCNINPSLGASVEPGPARRNPTQIVAATCGRFHAVILQEATDHVPQVSDQFIAAILLNRDTFEPNAAVFAFSRSFDKQGHVEHGSPCGSRTFTTPLPFRHPHGHVVLCPPSQAVAT